MKKIFLCAIALIFAVNLSAQVADVYHEVLVEDLAGGSNVLIFGLDTTATDGIDPALGESDLPPFPPVGAFEARFFLPNNAFDGSLGSYQDYRQALLPFSGQKEYRLAYQVGTGTVIKITWDFPPDITGLLQDIITGTLINVPMADSGSFTVSDPGAFNRLKMFITYNNTVPVELTSFGASINGSTVILNWQTSSEINNRGFEIERKSENSNWERIGFVNGAGTSSETRLYSFVDNNITTGISAYRLKQLDFNGEFSYSKEVEVDFTLSEYTLYQNYPNPFNPSTSIQFAVPQEGFVTVKIYDMLGQEIATLFSGNTKTGIYTLNWNGKDNYGNNVSSGNYICKMNAGDFIETRKMNLIK